MEQDGSPKTYTKKSLIILLLICLGILAYGFLFSRNHSTNFSYLIGFNLIPFLIISTLYYYAVLKNQGIKKGALAFVSIYVSLMVSSYISSAHQQQLSRQAFTQIKNEFNTLVESSTDAEGFPKPIDQDIDTAPTTIGEYGQLERILKEHFKRLAGHQNNYLSELESIGWNSILDAQRIQDDQTFAQSREMIRQVKDLIPVYRRKVYALNDLLRKDVESMKAPVGMKWEFLRGFDEERKDTDKKVDEIYELEAQILGEFEKSINLLAENTDAWSVEENMIYFNSDEDLKRYNNHMEAIQTYLNRQLEIRSGAIDKANRSFDSAID